MMTLEVAVAIAVVCLLAVGMAWALWPRSPKKSDFHDKSNFYESDIGMQGYDSPNHSNPGNDHG
jgi:hypothetical protein